MDSWLKGLVTVTCLAVLAAAGFYITAEISKKKMDDPGGTSNLVRSELFYLAGAKADDVSGVRGYCQLLQTRQQGGQSDDKTTRLLRNCRALGFL
ncbi:hypothetical protein [Mesorhizobium loti]|uniref:hypothetical protein n=1 Tax=Rhizobium loti TaxID=381 RepID=UPI0012DB3500|nr:hypothetical protein [Mesorhizobium loti]